MTAPALPGFSGQLYQRLAFMATEDASKGYALAHLCRAVGAQFDEVDSVVMDAPDGTPGWARILNPDTAPVFALPWLSQLAGVRLPAGLTEQQQRDTIKAMAGLRRGTPAAIIAATQLHLTGERRVILTERDGGNAYQLRVQTYSSETPDEALVEASLMTQKIIGVRFIYEVIDGWTYDQLAEEYAGQDYDDLAGDFTDYAELHNHLP